MEVSKCIEQALTCGRVLCAGFPAAGLPQKLQMHILSELFFTLAVPCFSTVTIGTIVPHRLSEPPLV